MSELTESELVALRNNLMDAQSKTKKELKARRMRVVGKVLLYTAVIAGGAVSVVFPNPTTTVALVGIVALIEGKGRITHSLKKMKKQKQERKEEKRELLKVGDEVNKRATTRFTINKMYPSAPPMYPNI